MAYYGSSTMFTVVLSLCLFHAAVHCAVIQVIPDPEVSLTCWSCPEHPDNEACNNWAPDIICPLHRTWCMSVNRVDMVTGLSVAVYKRCAEELECSIDNIGCYASLIPGVMECKTCCNEDYCNEPVPYNATSAIELSSYYSSGSSSATYCKSLVLTIISVLSLLAQWQRH